MVGQFTRGTDGYLEIGPGYGQYLLKALRSGIFNRYLAVDISLTSVRQCREFLSYCGMDEAEYQIQHADFLGFSSARKFSSIVMGEVLEHVEQPLMMLQKIHSLLADEGTAFIATVINAPAVDHIYLFRSEKEVLNMVREARFTVEDYKKY